MQIQTQGLIQFALPLFPTAEVWGEVCVWGGHPLPAPLFSPPSLPIPCRKTSWGSSSSSTPRRPACTSSRPCWTAGGCTRWAWGGRGGCGQLPELPQTPPKNFCILPQDYLDALIGICYDGVEGLLYLVLFSLLVAASFSTIICATPRAWKHLAGR